MKRICVGPIPEDVWRAARIKAIQGDTTVSALVRDYLMQLGGTRLNLEESSLDKLPPEE
jgi:hypothetical protein